MAIEFRKVYYYRSFGITMKHSTKQNSSICCLNGKIGIQSNNTVYTSKEKINNLLLKILPPQNRFALLMFIIWNFIVFWNFESLYIACVKTLKNTVVVVCLLLRNNYIAWDLVTYGSNDQNCINHVCLPIVRQRLKVHFI